MSAPVQYSKRRQEQCVHCAAGLPMHLPTSREFSGHHWTPEDIQPKCTARDPEEYIRELEAELMASKLTEQLAIQNRENAHDLAREMIKKLEQAEKHSRELHMRLEQAQKQLNAYSW